MVDIKERLRIKKRVLSLKGFISIQEFGKAIGMSQAQFSIYLHGRRPLSEAQINRLDFLCEHVEKLSRIFKVSEKQNKKSNGQITK